MIGLTTCGVPKIEITEGFLGVQVYCRTAGAGASPRPVQPTNMMYGRCHLDVYPFPLFTLGDFCKNFLFVQTRFFIELGRSSSVALPANELQSSEIIVNR